MIGLIMLATTFAPPQPIQPQNWLYPNDYPTSIVGDVDTQISRRVAFVIDPDGKPVSCVLLMVQDAGKFKSPICERLTRHARFKPAMEDGHPAWGVWTMSVNFLIPGDAARNSINYDIIVPVNRLPGKGIPQGVVINQLVDAHGKVEACNVVDASVYDALNTLACDVTNVLPVAQVTDREGNPVRSVIKQTVLFAVDPAAKHQ